MRMWNVLGRGTLLAVALLGGIGEFALLQRWRLRDWLLRHAR